MNPGDPEIDLLVSEGSVFTDPRLCSWCGEPYEVQGMLSARIGLASGGFWTAEGTDMTLAICRRDGVFVLS